MEKGEKKRQDSRVSSQSVKGMAVRRYECAMLLLMARKLEEGMDGESTSSYSDETVMPFINSCLLSPVYSVSLIL